jgi:D-alanine-D-alanine ligase
MLDSKLKIAVLAGGVGTERSVSLESGASVAKALSGIGEVVVSDIGPNNLSILDDSSIDLYFIALHGAFGEDGKLQKILDVKGLAYTGSGAKASELAFNKMASKKVFVQNEVICPTAIEFYGDIKSIKKIPSSNGKYVVKPTKEGSSFGVSIVKGWENALTTAKECYQKFGNCMIEEFISGMELTVGILAGQVLPIIEIRPKNEFYDFNAKYIDDKTEFVFDTIENAELVGKIQKAAMTCFKAIGAKDFGRVDFILDKNNKFYALEINTIPGMTSHSLLPKAAAKIELSMSDLCRKVIESVLKEKNTLKKSAALI